MKTLNMMALVLTLASFGAFAQSTRGDGPGNNSASSLACELDIKSQIDVDVWFGLFQTRQINQPFKKAGSLKLNETGLKYMNTKELFIYSQQLHRLLSAYGHKGLESETVNSIRELKDEDATVCDLAKTLSINYTFLNN